jgi:transcriptional regulator GlxA family with amidase domain
MVQKLKADFPEQSEVFVFLVTPGVSMMSLASAIEPLRSLNRLVRRDAYEWRLASPDGRSVEASNGIPLPVLPHAEALVGADYLFVCGGLRIEQEGEKHYLAVLRQAVRKGISVGSLSTGTYLLARAGLLNGYRCTIHWENLSTFQEDFPNIHCTNKIYEIDRERLTCSGGTAAMDLVLHLIAEKHGADLARSVANQFHHERIRNHSDEQQGGRLEVLAHMSSTLRVAISLMQNHIEDPLPLPTIARRVGVSTRHLERQFIRHTGTPPLKYYLRMRIERARELLIYSDRSVIDIAISCGFTSTSHFATWYKKIFGIKPSEVRRRGPLSPIRLSDEGQ